jgi:hypothetical protein
MIGRRGAGFRWRLLRIYLNDHLMGSVVGIELARRCLRSNRGTPLGAFLEELLTEVTEDRAALEKLMAALALPPDPVKLAAAVIAERVGRLKLNGRLLGYSDLSRLVELEGLYAAVALKLRMWLSLQHVAATDPRFAVIDLERLVERASSQLTRLERQRLYAAERAFS